MINKPHVLPWLDGLRGLAALMVMVGHARWLLWEGYSKGFLLHPDEYSAAQRLLVYLFAPFRYGHEAVIFFFVLSGFVIHLRYGNDLAAQGPGGGFRWKDYLLRRAKRLVPPLLFALAATYACDRIGMMAGLTIYSTSVGPGEALPAMPSHSVKTLIGNLCFVMGTYTPAWGTNWPLATLKSEWWFYMSYPVLLLLAKGSMHRVSLLLLVAFGAAFWPGVFAVALAYDVFSMMLIWWLGAIVAQSYRLGQSLRGLSLLTLCGPLTIWIPLQPRTEDLCWGLTFTGCLAICLELSKRGFQLGLLRALKPLGEISYSLYLVHFPLLILISGFVRDASPHNALPRHFGWSVFGIAASTCLAIVSYLVAERPVTGSAISSRPLPTPPPGSFPTK